MNLVLNNEYLAYTFTLLNSMQGKYVLFSSEATLYVLFCLSVCQMNLVFNNVYLEYTFTLLNSMQGKYVFLVAKLHTLVSCLSDSIKSISSVCYA